MSLKGFHIVFIIVSVLCTLGFAAWTIWAPEYRVTPATKAIGLFSGVCGLFLLFYGAWFLRKSRDLIV